MGGLGPTEDDLTREAVAEALDLKLKRDAAQVAALHARAAMWRFPMPDNNLKQADVIQGATVLPNPNGSAPGQWLDVTYEGYRKLVMLIPGPPGECKPLFEEQCMPLREDHCAAAVYCHAHAEGGDDRGVAGGQSCWRRFTPRTRTWRRPSWRTTATSSSA